MNITLERNFEKLKVTTEFRNTLAMFCGNSESPYAMRAPLDAEIPVKDPDGSDIVSASGELTVAIRDNRIYCRFGNEKDYTAIISFTEQKDMLKTAGEIERYFHDANVVLRSNLASRSNHDRLNGLIAQTSDFCGCLTDINQPDEGGELIHGNSASERRTDHSAMIALGTVCLLFRRISALRGFNFKLIFNEGLPSLAFSAKIIGGGIESIKDLPEYSALADLDSRGGITVYSRLMKLTPEDDEELFRLTLVLTLQGEDPSGILRAPQWKERTRRTLDGLDLDVPGRF